MSENSLKNKRIGIASTSNRFIYNEEESGYWYLDVKSAVQGLIQEMEKIELKNMTLIDLLYKIKQLIKKYFPDEVKEKA